MVEFLNSLSMVEKVFLGCAIVGTSLFLFRTVLLMMGADSDSDIGDIGDVGDVGDIDFDGDTSMDSPDASFQILSLQGLSSFFMMFGLVGLAMTRSSHTSETWAILAGVIAGFFTVWVMSRIFVGMKKLQADGTLNYSRAVGSEGKVYLGIPAEGEGKVQIVLQGGLKICNAVSANKEELPTGTLVKVVRLSGSNTMVVEKAG